MTTLTPPTVPDEAPAPVRDSVISRVRGVWRNRSVLGLLVQRDLKVRYSDSFLGYIWTFLDPLLMIAVYAFVFTVFFVRKNPAENPFVLFLASGVLPWNWARTVMSEAPSALEGQAKLVRSASLPREVWILRLVISNALQYVFSLPVLVGLMLLYGKHLTKYAVLYPAAVTLQFVLLTALTLLIAPVTVMIPDFQRILKIVIRVLFYLTPILYSVTTASDKLKTLFLFNPFAGIFNVYHSMLYPQQWEGLRPLEASAAITLVLLVLGWWVFRKLEPAVLKEV